MHKTSGSKIIGQKFMSTCVSSTKNFNKTNGNYQVDLFPVYAIIVVIKEELLCINVQKKHSWY